MKAVNFKEEQLEINGVQILITAYKAGDIYHCHVANTDPGAVIARASAQNAEEAKQAALKKAKNRLTPLKHL
jgi:hypothetical protein